LFFERPEVGRQAILLLPEFKQLASAADGAECAELARSAGIDVVEQLTFSREVPHPRWFVGAGKLEELRQRLAATGADLLVVNGDPSAGQQRNLERALEVRLITRTELILHIFADRARTHEGQLQVELAQLRHAQTRLVRGWTHLDRQKGGIGMRGAGETQIEMDQRALGERVKAVRARLDRVVARRSQNRRRRDRGGARTVALVGYTNAGKSTLFNALTRGGVLTEDKLFATLDPTMRQLPVPGAGEVVLADTVGFIDALPHTLIEAFKATLEEVVNADLLLHLVDATDPLQAERIVQVREVLDEIGAADLPSLVVFNKIDALDAESRARVAQPQVWLRPLASAESPEARAVGSLAVSALTGEGLERLRDAIAAALGVCAPAEVVLPAEDGKTRAWLYRLGAVLAERVRDDGRLALTVQGDRALLDRLERLPRVLLRADGPLPKISPLPN